MGYLKAHAIRKDLEGVQISPEVFEVLDRHIEQILKDAKKRTKEIGKKCLTATIVRGGLKR